MGNFLWAAKSNQPGYAQTWDLRRIVDRLSKRSATLGLRVLLCGTAAVACGCHSDTPTQVGVTDLPGVFTYHNDAARDGVNSQEYLLTPANVNTASFHKLFSCKADGAIYAQPLWIRNLTVNGAYHNVAFVATAHDSLYAFDADANPCVQLWSVSLIDSKHGGTLGETTVPTGTSDYLVGAGGGESAPEVGVTGTPVIDPTTNILYVVSKSVAIGPTGTNFYQRLHAIDISTGAEKSGSPTLIQATYPGTGDGSRLVTFNARMQFQRPGLALSNGVIYVAFGSHADVAPYYGWVIGYRYGSSGFSQTAALNVTPNGQYGGIWMGGSAPAVDSNGYIYLLTGNGPFDATDPTSPNNDYSDSLLQLSATAPTATPHTGLPAGRADGLSVVQYFTPSDEYQDFVADDDFGSGGAAVLADVTAGSPPKTTHLIVGGGKDGTLYILNRDALGGFGDMNAWQMISTGYGIFSTIAFWNDTIYLVPLHSAPTANYLDTSSTPIKFAVGFTGTSPSGGFGFPAATPSISASGSTNGVLWALDNSQYCTPGSPGCGPTVLHAYDATSLLELWNSSMAAGNTDAAGNAVKFAVPTIANGKVYVGTRGNNSGGVTASSTIPGELDVYGLRSE